MNQSEICRWFKAGNRYTRKIANSSGNISEGKWNEGTAYEY